MLNILSKSDDGPEGRAFCVAYTQRFADDLSRGGCSTAYFQTHAEREYFIRTLEQGEAVARLQLGVESLHRQAEALTLENKRMRASRRAFLVRRQR